MTCIGGPSKGGRSTERSELDQQTEPNTATARRRLSLPPALKYPAYRAYWLGMLASVSGFQMYRAAQAWFVYDLTGSPLWLGIAAASNAVPAIFFNLFGGVFADKVDKRRLIIVTQIMSGGLIFLLATLTLLGIAEVWHVLAIAFLAGAVEAFDTPARQAIYPHLIDRRVMMSAVALNSSIWSGNRIIAPAVAGLIIAVSNMETAFFVAGTGFIVMAAVMFRLKIAHIEPGATGSPVRNLIEGLDYIRTNFLFTFLIGMTFFNSFFGMAYVFLMPVFAQDILNLGPSAYGILLSAGGVGSLLTTVGIGYASNDRYKGLLIIGGAVLFGLLLIVFALTSEFVGSFPLAMALLFLMGISTSTYMISIQSFLQIMVPDGMRGRVMGFYGMTWSIMPLGGLQAGALAQFTSAPLALVAGGIAVVAFALGPALLNGRIRNMGGGLSLPEAEAAPTDEAATPAHATGND